MIDYDEILELSRGLKLLYVEDNKDAREMTTMILENFFDSIVIAVDGKDGYEKFKENDIDLIITDINMPVLNGLKMTEKIRVLDDEIPILILSAHNETDYFIDSIKLDIDGYLLKPIDIDQLLLPLSKCIKNITLKKENIKYKKSLEVKVEVQTEELNTKDELLIQQSKMASIGEMLDAIGHQWKQPLNAIDMAAELIDINIIDNNFEKEELQESTDTIKTQVKHMVNTMNEFRSFFRPNNNIQKLNLKTLLNSVLLLLKDELIKSSVTVEILCDAKITLNANENDIKHLFLNLISNAKEAMIKKNIAPNKRVVTIECSTKNSQLQILVKDRGTGISQDIIANIFKANFTTKEDTGGTGIGLYICKQIVNKYMGKLTVSNDENGAVFKITFRSGND